MIRYTEKFVMVRKRGCLSFRSNASEWVVMVLSIGRMFLKEFSEERKGCVECFDLFFFCNGICVLRASFVIRVFVYY